MKLITLLLCLILVYYVVLHGIYLLLILLGALRIRRYQREITFDEFRQIAESSLSMPVSLIIPCYNEAAILAGTIANALLLDYPEFEILIVSDGSTDGTIPLLRARYGLQKIDRHGCRKISTKEILGIYESSTHSKLVVIDKVNGRRADAINAAVNEARYPLLCIIDADCVLEKDTLLRLARPFLRDSRTGAVAGIVRPSNGLTVEEGEIVSKGFPRTLLGMNQEIEYARSFQWARIGLSSLHSMLCISGALLLIRKDLFERVGGSWPGAITDDIELTMRLNREVQDLRKKNTPRLLFAPDAVCYTEVPETVSQYASQRNRWQRGTLQGIARNRGMLFNPAYGLTGLFGMPFFLIFEGLAALVELSAWILMVACLLINIATWHEILIMIYLAYIAGVFVSLTAVLITESGRFRATSWSDFWRLLLAILLDNLGFHQFHLLIRALATFQYAVLGRRDLGQPMTRNGHTPILHPTITP